MASARKGRKAGPKSFPPIVTRNFRIPCFAHQDLDPVRFPPGMGVPIGGPLSWSTPPGFTGENQGAWEDSGDEEDVEDREAKVEAKTPKKKTPSLKRKREPKPKVKPNNTYKRLKVPGGRPAIAKKVVADLDSDDEMITRMKDAKYLEKDIAQALVDDGRIAYNPKTIGTRYARIRRVKAKEMDLLLDAEQTDWHDGDDDALEEAVERANAEVTRLVNIAEAKKWKIVAHELKKIKPVVNFSQNACHDRHLALESGTAKPTPESVANPNQEVQARIEVRKEKERRIEEDALLWNPGKANLEGNSWTSRSVKFF